MPKGYSNQTGKKLGGKRTGAGRPKGSVNKTTIEVRELARQHGAAAIQKLVALMSIGESEDVQLRAANSLLDRGYGKAAQPTHIGGHDGGPLNLHEMSDEQLDSLAERLVAANAAAASSGTDSE